MAESDASELSQAGQTFLIVAGASAVALVLVALWAFVSIVRSVSRFLSAATIGGSKPVARKPSKKQLSKAKSSDTEDEPVAQLPVKERGPDLKSLIKAEKSAKKKGATKEEVQAQHELFLNTLKDHADTVTGLAWSRDGRLLASSCEDMQLRIFDLEDVTSKNPKFKRVRTARIPVGVGFCDGPDAVATAMRGTPDTLAAAYAPVQRPTGDTAYEPKWTVDHVHGKEPPLAMASVPSEAAVGRRGYIVSLSTKRDGKLLDLEGRAIADLAPNALANHDLAVSLDGRFIAVATFSSDVKIWEMKYSREGEFKGLSRVMGLSGHRSQVACVALSPDNRRAATASKDGMLKVWSIDVRYELSEDPKVVLSIPMPLPEGRVYSRLAFGPPGSDMLAAAFEGTVQLINLRSGELLERIHAHDAPVTALTWCPLPRLLAGPGSGGAAGFVFATASRDKRVRVWRAPKF